MTILSIVLATLSSCGKAIDSNSLLPIPVVNTSQFDDTVKKQVNDVMANLNAKPLKAELNGKAAMTLHVYRLLDEAEVLYLRAHAIHPDDIRWIYYHALVLQKKGDLVAALVEFDRAIALDPGNTLIKIAAADSLIEVGEFDKATQRYEQLLATHTDSPEIWHGYGRLLRTNGDYEKSIDAYKKVINLAGHFSPAYFGIAQNFRQLGNFEQAEFYENLRVKHENAAIGIKDEFGAALRRLDRSVSTRNRIARRLVSLGKVDEAISILKTVCRDEPDNAGAHISLIGLYTSREDYDEVEFHIAEAKRLASNIPKLHFNLGTYYLKTGKFPEAVEAFKRAAELSPEEADTLVRLGMAYEQLGEKDKAEEVFLTALSKDAAHREANFLLGRQYSQQKLFAKAIPLLKLAAVKNDKKRPVYLNILARVQAFSGDMESAFATSEETMSLLTESTDPELAERVRNDHARISESRDGATR